MNKINVKLCEITTRVIAIGFEGENNHTQVAFDCSPVFADYPNAVASLAVKPPVGSIYPKVVTKSGNEVLWDVSASDCAYDGSGEYQLTFTNGEEIIKTWTGNMRVYASLLTNGNPPTPIEDWLEAANAVLGALEDMTASASGLPAGSDPTAEMTEVGGHKNIALGIPAGEQGEPGEDGFSPVITVTDITGGHRITIVDAEGTHTVDVMDGAQGDPGQDGYSPTVAITDITGGHTVTITDKNGAHAFNVMDGTPGFSPVATVTKSGTTATISITDAQGTTTAQISDGNPAELIDDTTPAANKTFSSDKLNTELSGLLNATNYTYARTESDKVPSANLFDLNDDSNRTGEYWLNDGTLRTNQGARYCRSHSIPVRKGTYRFYCPSSSFGTNNTSVAVVNENGTLLRMNNGERIEGNVNIVDVEFVFPCLVQINYSALVASQTMFCRVENYPAVYIGAGQETANTSEANTALKTIRSMIEPQKNLFDRFDSENKAGQYYRLTGDLKTEQSANLCTSHPIRIGAGTYKFTLSSTFGGNKGAVAVLNNDGDVIRIISAEVNENVGTFNVDRACSVCINYAADIGETIVFCESSKWDGTYHAYEKWIDKNLIKPIQKTETDFFIHEVSENLVDLSGLITGKYFKPADGVLTNYTNRPIVSVYVKLDGAGTYSTKNTKKLFGSNASKLALFNASKQYIATVTGTLGDDSNVYSVPLQFEVTEQNITDGAVYFGLSIEYEYMTTTMAVKSSTYPSEYIPYYDRWTINDLTVKAGQAPSLEPNPLTGKVAIFDGDSICNDDTDTSGYGGYPGRIAYRNGMAIRNFAVSGGTLTSGLMNGSDNPRHWVSGNVDAMYAAYPDADYIIFEGGTNDADLIGSILNNNSPAAFGSYTDNDFSGTYDDETFCGAVETIFFKAMSYWATKKIGFVIAMKMGTNTNTYNNRRAYFQTIMDICKKWGVPYINVWDECTMNPNLTSCYDSTMTEEENINAGKLYKDGQHPTPTGYERITPIIEAWMKTL